MAAMIQSVVSTNVCVQMLILSDSLHQILHSSND